MNPNEYIARFKDVDNKCINQVGGKNASLGEMIQKLATKGIKIPDGFAVTAHSYRYLLSQNNITKTLTETLEQLDTKDFKNLREISS